MPEPPAGPSQGTTHARCSQPTLRSLTNFWKRIFALNYAKLHFRVRRMPLLPGCTYLRTGATECVCHFQYAVTLMTRSRSSAQVEVLGSAGSCQPSPLKSSQMENFWSVQLLLQHHAGLIWIICMVDGEESYSFFRWHSTGYTLDIGSLAECCVTGHLKLWPFFSVFSDPENTDLCYWKYNKSFSGQI